METEGKMPGNEARWRTQGLVMAGWALPNAIMVSLINIALPDIQTEFAVGPGALVWAASGYIVAGAIGAVVYGRLSDVFGLRNIAVFCLLAFAFMSLCVAFAPGFAWLVGIRIFQGLVGMALPTIGMGGVLLLLPPHLRGRAIGQMMVVFGLGVVIGSFGGGLLIEMAGWRAPFVVVAVVALLFVLPTIAAIPRLEKSANPPVLDKIGGLLVTIAVGSTLIAANQLPRQSGLELGLVALVVAVVFWTAFLRQIQQSAHPFVDPVILRSMPFLRSCMLGGVAQGQFVMAGFVFPLALTRLAGYSVADVGFIMSPGLLAVLVAGYLGPRLAITLGNRYTLVMAAAFSVAGALGSTLLGVQNTVAVVLLYTCFGAQYALVQSVVINAAGRLLPPGYTGSGMGFYNFAYFSAGAFCVALAGGIIERRALADQAWIGLSTGPATGYVDAMLILAVLSIAGIGLLISLWHDPDFARPPGNPARG